MEYRQQSRLDRIYTQKFYLIDQGSFTDHNEQSSSQEHIFVISGSTANLYNVVLSFSHRTIKCDCPDGIRNRCEGGDVGIKCKHCCFVLLKVLRLRNFWLEIERLDTFQWNKIRTRCQNLVIQSELVNPSYGFRYQQLMIEKLGQPDRIEKGEDKEENSKFVVTRELEPDNDCPICFDILKVENSFQCPTCSNVIHQTCMKKWLLTGRKNCVYCRGDWSELVSKKEPDNEIPKYTNLASGCGQD